MNGPGLIACGALSLVLAAAPVGVRAGPVVSHALEELTWTEVREFVAGGGTTAIVPVGGTEQNGPHLVLGKHNARVRALALRIARELGDALVAPVVAYVPEGAIEPPSSHMRWAGTLSVPTAAFEQVLESAARSLRAHGFTTVVFLGDHGGYQASLAAVAARLNRSWAGSRARAVAIAEYFQATESAYPALLRERGYRDDEIGAHAGLADTSLALAIDPGLVRSARLAAPPNPGDGVRGDPRRASAELGRLGVDAIVEASVAAIRARTSSPTTRNATADPPAPTRRNRP